jgi:hypothetical protein
MKLLRRFRPLLAGLALLLSPGVLAPWLSLAHACPTEAAAPAAAPAGGGHHHAHQSDPAPAHGSGHELHTCICIGACQMAALILPRPQSGPVVAILAAAGDGFQARVARLLPHQRRLLPPATAPPVLA